ncbi:MAG: hypothetical protein ACE5OO_05620, partial [Candidatus Bathyarchaeia archaeon]
NGLALREACIRAMKDVHALKDTGSMNCLALDRHGNTMSASISRESIHYYMDIDSPEPEERRGVWVKA